MSRAIFTKYESATETEGSRFVASLSDTSLDPAWAKSVIVPYDYGLEASANHLRAAQELARLTGWGGEWHGGTLEDGRYVWVRRDGQNSFTLEG